jgi:hypothetical protein
MRHRIIPAVLLFAIALGWTDGASGAVVYRSGEGAVPEGVVRAIEEVKREIDSWATVAFKAECVYETTSQWRAVNPEELRRDPDRAAVEEIRSPHPFVSRVRLDFARRPGAQLVRVDPITVAPQHIESRVLAPRVFKRDGTRVETYYETDKVLRVDERKVPGADRPREILLPDDALAHEFTDDWLAQAAGFGPDLRDRYLKDIEVTRTVTSTKADGAAEEVVLRDEFRVPQVFSASGPVHVVRTVRYSSDSEWRPVEITRSFNGNPRHHFRLVWSKVRAGGRDRWFPTRLESEVFHPEPKPGEPPRLLVGECLTINPESIRMGDDVREEDFSFQPPPDIKTVRVREPVGQSRRPAAGLHSALVGGQLEMRSDPTAPRESQAAHLPLLFPIGVVIVGMMLMAEVIRRRGVGAPPPG